MSVKPDTRHVYRKVIVNGEGVHRNLLRRFNEFECFGELHGYPEMPGEAVARPFGQDAHGNTGIDKAFGHFIDGAITTHRKYFPEPLRCRLAGQFSGMAAALCKLKRTLQVEFVALGNNSSFYRRAIGGAGEFIDNEKYLVIFVHNFGQTKVGKQAVMDFATPKNRKIKFKAWDTESRLLMRLNSIECTKGELFKKDHILLQFTGLLDKEGEEIYDRDVLLIHYSKYTVFWNDEKNGWYYSPLENPATQEPFLLAVAEKMKRFCSYFELNGDDAVKKR